MYNPSLAGDANCYSSSTPDQRGPLGGRPGQPLVLPARRGRRTNGQPTSPTCNSTSSITGIGIVSKAIKIMYNAMLMKTSSSSYLKYRTWTLTAAKNLYRARAPSSTVVKAAWNAVSVPAQTGDPTCLDQRHQHGHGDQPGQPDRHRRHRQEPADLRVRLASGQTLDLLGHRAPGRPVDQRLHRPDLPAPRRRRPPHHDR